MANSPASYGARRAPRMGSDDPWAEGGWGPATPVRSASALAATASDTVDQEASALPRRLRERERGLPGWAALIVLLAVAGVGGAIDSISGAQIRGGFNVGIVVAAIVAILLVRRTGMFPIVIAPPIVYAGASAAMLYVRSGGLHDRKVLFDAAANWLVYGFPAIAAATAAVLIIAGIRLIVRR